jgi:hypothetical protein
MLLLPVSAQGRSDLLWSEALRFACRAVLVCILMAGIARPASVLPGRHAWNTPIQIINTNAGRVISAGARQYGDVVYITGLVSRPSSPGIAPHVHVWGVDAKKHTVFFKTSLVMVTGKPSFIQSESYIVSVSPVVFAKAKVVYVTFHSQTDAQAEETE